MVVNWNTHTRTHFLSLILLIIFDKLILLYNIKLFKDYGTEIPQQQYRNLTRTFSAPDESIPPEMASPRRTSLNELSEDEIILAYNRLQMQKQQPPKENIENKAKDDENYQEFLKWMQMKKHNQDTDRVEKVKPNDDEIIAETKSEKTEIETSTNTTTTTTQHSDFDDFKDAIESDESLKVPLVIVEENEASALIPTVIEDNIISHEPSPSSETSDSNIVNAKLMLSNEPLQIVTNLSQSSMSLASIKSTDESGNKKRPATHKKGPAPPPPPSSSTSSSDVNVEIQGFFFHKLTKKLFKETEL